MSNRVDIKIDKARCRQCFECEKACPSDVFHWESDRVVIDHRGRCIKCGHCVAACRDGAFDHKALPAQRFEPLRGVQSGDIDILERLFSERRSCRRFDDGPVSREDIAALIERTRYAPTATNAQNIRYIVLTDRTSIRELSKRIGAHYLKLARRMNNPITRAAIALKEGAKMVGIYRYHMTALKDRFDTLQDDEQDRLFYNAPVVIIAYASGMWHLAYAGCNLAAMQLLLTADAMSLGACYNGYALTALTQDKRLRKYIGVPKGYHPAAVIALGHPAAQFYRIPPRRKPRIIW
ncbi:MAG: nitroreductase family protein [Myxococcota bacterium]|nr:nitroreductase family protein [Myxococcota bacterium]